MLPRNIATSRTLFGILRFGNLVLIGSVSVVSECQSVSVSVSGVSITRGGLLTSISVTRSHITKKSFDFMLDLIDRRKNSKKRTPTLSSTPTNNTTLLLHRLLLIR